MTFRTEAGITSESFLLLFLLYFVWTVLYYDAGQKERLGPAGLCSWVNLKSVCEQMDLIIIWTPFCVDLAGGDFAYLIWILFVLKMICAVASQMLIKSQCVYEL